MLLAMPKTDRRVIAPWGWGQSLLPGMTWYRLIPIDPFCGILLWEVSSNLGAFALFGILGTLQWYLIGLFIGAVLKRLF